ncbi:MAG TPA: carboxypeptidase regulatory-like domain-containing protein [Vicinamibacterales bacterium]|nr:carboxypeptidase regulatory-like domain-containing protein [Vicinamibacterales bacterium]
MNSAGRSAVIATLVWALSAVSGSAQTIAGTVRDSSGAVLPGVTVEASSPALIEKVRTVVSDGAGQYQIVSLVSGTYTVTFTLPGFNSIRREGIQLSENFTANVSAELKVGSVEETIVVSGSSPVVDVQSIGAQKRVMTREVLDTIPIARNIAAAGVLIPGATVSGASNGGRDVGGNAAMQQATITYHGSADQIIAWEGVRLNNMDGNGNGQSVVANDGSLQEISYTTGIDTIELAEGGIRVNQVPRDGGNRLNGSAYADFTHTPWQWSNLRTNLTDRGITNVTKVYLLRDLNGSVGGPIRRDHLWFFVSGRYNVFDTTYVDSYFNRNPTPFAYVPDLSRPGHDDGVVPNWTGRLTSQLGSKDKVTFWFSDQRKYRTHYNISASITPEATAVQHTPYSAVYITKWVRTQTSRLLFDVSLGILDSHYDLDYQPGTTPTTLSYTDQANGKFTGAYSAGESHLWSSMETLPFSATYVTGSHAIKAGGSIGAAQHRNIRLYNGDVTMTLNGGIAQSATLRASQDSRESLWPDLQFFAQDKWTYRRVTMNLGLRYDDLTGYAPPNDLPANRWMPARHFERTDIQHWKDVDPRVGVAIDLFGTGRTALKAGIGRFVAKVGSTTVAQNAPQATIGPTDVRTWRDLNGDFTIYNADGTLQAEELGASSNANFGKIIPSTTETDPSTLRGWNSRGKSWEYSTSVQHELRPGVVLYGGYYLRRFGNDVVTDNTLIDASSFTGPFCVTAPTSQDLPGGGGYQVCGLYDITAAARPLVHNFITKASSVGDIRNTYKGFDIGTNAQLPRGTFVNAGLNFQNRHLDACNAPMLSGTTVYQVDSPESRFCDQQFPFRPDFKLLGSTRLPYDMQVSATFQVASGPNITATWQAPNAIIAPALGRNLAAGATATKSIQLIEPGTGYGDTLFQTDVRLSKRIRLGPIRIRGDVNLYNLFNSNFASTLNSNFSTSASNQFLRPTNVLQGRLFKIDAQIDF